MKKLFEMPNVSVTKFDVCDVISASKDDPVLDENEGAIDPD